MSDEQRKMILDRIAFRKNLARELARRGEWAASEVQGRIIKNLEKQLVR